MKVVVIDPERGLSVRTIDGSLESMQKVVGGYIEVYPHLFKDYLLILNEEGKLEDLKPNFWVQKRADVIVGTVFICKDDDEGEMVGLTDDEIADVVFRCRQLDYCTEAVDLDQFMKVEFYIEENGEWKKQ